MKKLLTIPILFLICVFLNSCRKEKKALFDGINCSNNCYILTGNLLDSASKTGIEGEIKFYFNDITGTFNSKKIFLGRTISNSNGNYTFKFDGSQLKNVRGYYIVEAYKGNMFGDISYPNRVGTFDLDTSFYNVPFFQNFALFIPAIIKVRVIATSVTSFQYLNVGYSYGKVGYGIVFHGGRKIDTTITWKTAGNLRTFIQADAVGNGVNIMKRDTIIVSANSTRQIEIRL